VVWLTITVVLAQDQPDKAVFDWQLGLQILSTGLPLTARFLIPTLNFETPLDRRAGYDRTGTHYHVIKIRHPQEIIQSTIVGK
jgi:hypothetical protein